MKQKINTIEKINKVKHRSSEKTNKSDKPLVRLGNKEKKHKPYQE